MIVKGQQAKVSDAFSAEVVWMDETPLALGKEYLFKVGTKSTYGKVVGIKHSVDVNTMQKKPATALNLNEVALVDVQLNSPVVFDNYKESRGTGGFIIIDRFTNITIAAGMIESEEESSSVLGDDISIMSYEQRLSAFNADVANLVRKYFPER